MITVPVLRDESRQQRADSLLERVAAQVDSERPLPRLLLVFAHPDDEVLAVGGRLERFAASRLVTVTDGAPKDGRDARDHGFENLTTYRTVRVKEQEKALIGAGLPPEFRIAFMRVADQTAALHLAQLARAVAEEIKAFCPEAVLTHPYEGGHPDHDACAFAVQCGVQLLAEANADDAPLILEAPSYHAGSNGMMRTGEFLPDDIETPLVAVELTTEESQKKGSRLACFVSQTETLAQFGLEHEMFRVAPPYDFTRPPHMGQLLYERFGWEMTGERFCELARAAMVELFGADGLGGMRESTVS